MTVEQRLDRTEANLGRLAAVQDQMMDLLGMTMEGERRLATRAERMDEEMKHFEAGQKALQDGHRELQDLVHEIGDKLNGLISVVDDMIRRKE
jgi:hypothetical protein